jgi:uncharacterized protein (DUF1330 family)
MVLLKRGMTLVAGAVIGAAAIQVLHAQSKPHAYFIADVAEISDAASFRSAAQKTGPTVEAAGGKQFIVTQYIVAIAGAPPQRISVIEFESLDAAKAWADKAEVKAQLAELDKYSKQRRFLVEGLK